MGNVDPSAILYHGTPIDVEKACVRCLKAASKGGGYILSSGCLIMPGFQKENLAAMVNASKKFGC